MIQKKSLYWFQVIRPALETIQIPQVLTILWHMDASVKKLSSEVLKLVNKLYNENQREEALECRER